MKAAIVIWNDAHSDDAVSWVSINERQDHAPFQVVTVGILLDSKTGRKRKHVSVAQSLTPSEYVDHVIHIPKQMIVEIIELFDIKVNNEEIELDSGRSEHRSRLSAKGRATRRARRARVDASSQQTTENEQVDLQ